MLAASYHDFGVKAVEAARRKLLEGGSALDAVEEGVKMVELDPANRTVGLGGYPNWAGDVELDAGIMDGDSLRACGVAAVKRVRNPISLARRCLDLLPHALIVGESATRLAEALKLETAPGSRAAPELLAEREKLEERVARGAGDLAAYYSKLFKAAAQVYHDTIGVIAVDAKGSVAAGTSTSGIAFKFPGRVADSAVVGAGFYADSRWGAAVLTGVGEVALRTSAAFRAVFLLSKGYMPQEAAEAVIEAAAEVARLDGEAYRLGVVVASKREIGAAALNWRGFKYVYWLGGEVEVREARWWNV
ncbi:MAG: isoaspartyl peptidase/L-asparaginase [Thermofilaceae archaeon]